MDPKGMSHPRLRWVPDLAPSLERGGRQEIVSMEIWNRLQSKEEVGRYLEQRGELLRLRFADRSLSAHNLRSYAAGTKHVK